MCGRYSLSTDPAQLKAQFGDVETGNEIRVSYNIAPTQYSAVITDEFPNVLQYYRWGLIPFWSKDEKIGSRLINARSESITEKPSFRAAIKYRRCLVIADSFYEWKKLDGKKIPNRILMKDGTLMIMAGIWELWSKGPAPIYSFSILTTAPNNEMKNLHNRMPLIFPDKELQRLWLDKELPQKEVLSLTAIPEDGILESYVVSTQVNSVKNNGPNLHNPFEPPRENTLFN